MVELNGIGERLRSERERLHLSKDECAELAQVTRMTQVRYEQGGHLPPVDFLANLQSHGLDALYVLTGVPSHDVLSIGPEDVEALGRASAIVDDLVRKHQFSASDEVRGRLIKQVLRNAAVRKLGGRPKAPTLEQLVAEIFRG